MRHVCLALLLLSLPACLTSQEVITDIQTAAVPGAHIPDVPFIHQQPELSKEQQETELALQSLKNELHEPSYAFPT